MATSASDTVTGTHETSPALAGRTALVTGASRGIGAAIATALVAHGARVALVARSAEPLAQLAGTLGERALVRPCDVTDAAAVTALAKALSTDFGGPPDLLINNAGIFHLAPLDRMPPELFVQTIQTNLVAPFLVIHAFLGAMRARGSGHLVTIGSIADRTVMAENGAYAPAKHGVRAMHEALRAELVGSGVRATLVSPAATDTTLWDPVLAEPHTRSLPARESMLPPSAVAQAVLYAVTQPPAVNVDELRLSHR